MSMVTIAKITRINSKTGAESLPEDATFDHRGGLVFPEPTDNDAWGVYVPLHGMSEPFYWLCQFSEDDVE